MTTEPGRGSSASVAPAMAQATGVRAGPARWPRARNGVQRAVFAQTSTIGLRVVPVGKVALERTEGSVEVLGGRVGVMVATDAGRVVNVSGEHDDVAALARATGLPVKEALRAATAAAAAAYPVAGT